MAYNRDNSLQIRKDFNFWVKNVESKSYTNGIYYKFLVSKKTTTGNWLNANITWFPRDDRTVLENGDKIRLNDISSISFTESNGRVYTDIVAECKITEKASQKQNQNFYTQNRVEDDVPSFNTDINSFTFEKKESNSFDTFKTDSFDSFNIDDDELNVDDDDIQF